MVDVGGAVHGQAGHAVQEVSEGEVDYEDGGVLQRGDVEAEYLVSLGPGDGSQGEEVARCSNDGDDNTAGMTIMLTRFGKSLSLYPTWCRR